MTKSHAELWPTRWWNTDAGRVVWWIGWHKQTGSELSRAAALMFYTMLVQDFGSEGALRQVQQFGVEPPVQAIKQ